MKMCRHCKQEKPLDEFSPNRRSPDGRHWWCKACNRAAAKARYQRSLDVERTRGRLSMRARRAADPVGERTKIETWRERNPERVRLHDETRRRTPSRQAWQADYWRRWKIDHPEASRLIARRGQQARRARRVAAFVEHVDPLIVLDTHKGICGICGAPSTRLTFTSITSSRSPVAASTHTQTRSPLTRDATS